MNDARRFAATFVTDARRFAATLLEADAKCRTDEQKAELAAAKRAIAANIEGPRVIAGSSDHPLRNIIVRDTDFAIGHRDIGRQMEAHKEQFRRERVAEAAADNRRQTRAEELMFGGAALVNDPDRVEVAP